MRLPRAVLLLGLVSLFMDMASEMLYPIAPIFLTTTLGASMAWLGVIEGIAEAIAGLGKGYFGMLSDAAGKRRPFVALGYGLAAISKPIPALSASVGGVLGARVLDRIGKGIRTAPRDALIAGHTTPDNRGAAFGLHRGMDTAGAALGPVIALLYLSLHPGDYSTLFLLAAIPAVAAAGMTLLVKEAPFTPAVKKPGVAESLRFWREAPVPYRRLLLLLTGFALVNSSDVFLIIRSRQLGFSDVAAIGGYIGYNAVFALAAYPAGRLSDRIGRGKTMVAGMLIFAFVYCGFALFTNHEMIWVMFGLYGLYAAMTEGVSKAWISDLVPNERRGLAIGLQTALTSIAAMVASGWTGAIWTIVDGTTPLLITATTTSILSFTLLWIVRNTPSPTPTQ
ncbi:MAG: MFS transporter [Armatimonadetes bacterium]|nr:MFS transporter [Armatimonadota bacterium]